MKQHVPRIFAFLILLLASAAVGLIQSHLGMVTALLLGAYVLDPLTDLIEEKGE